MKQQGTLALLVVISLTASGVATSATASSERGLQLEYGTSIEEAPHLPSGDAFIDLSDQAAERQALLARLSKTEALAATERQALQAQQRVLFALEQQQEVMESKLNMLEAATGGTSSSQGVVVDKGTLTNVAETKSSVVRLKAQPGEPVVRMAAAKPAHTVVETGSGAKRPSRGFLIMIRDSEKEFWAKYSKAFWEKMVGIAVYIVQIFIVAFIYRQFCKHTTIPKLHEQQVRTEEFQFGAFDANDLMRDCQMCLCAACCPWIRWADTSDMIEFVKFIPGLFITALLASAGSVTFGASIPILLLVVVLCRQRIREAYGLPSGTCGVLCGDCLLWICCPCCALVQEARQVEYVDPMQAYGV